MMMCVSMVTCGEDLMVWGFSVIGFVGVSSIPGNKSYICSYIKTNSEMLEWDGAVVLCRLMWHKYSKGMIVNGVLIFWSTRPYTVRSRGDDEMWLVELIDLQLFGVAPFQHQDTEGRKLKSGVEKCSCVIVCQCLCKGIMAFYDLQVTLMLVTICLLDTTQSPNAQVDCLGIIWEMWHHYSCF